MKRAAILSLVATCIFSASTAFAAVPSVHTSAVPSSTVTREASRTAAVPSASTRALPSGATTLPSQTKALPSMQRPGTAGAAEIAPQTLPDMSAFRIPPQSSAYAFHNDFGKSNLRTWSSTEGMDTPWNSNRTTDTVHLQSSTMAFLDTLNTAAQAAGVTFVITGGAEEGYHASGRYSHANGYKVDISDAGIYEGGRSYAVLMNALSAYKHQITHEWNLNHFDITIYPEDYDA